MIQKLYNLGLSFPNDNAIINNKKLTKINTEIKPNIIKYVLKVKYLINGVIRVAPVISSIKSYDLESNFHSLSNILLNEYYIKSIFSNIINMISTGIPKDFFLNTE